MIASLQSRARKFTLHGANRHAFLDRSSREVLCAGPAGSGKTVSALLKLYHFGETYPGARLLIVRKTRASLTETALVTWERDILGEGHPIIRRPIDRGHRHAYKFPNGSILVTGGMDKPEKVLSSEWDCVVGDTLVDSPSPIQRAYGRPYSGELVTITTASGNKLTGTPNHPVLTDNGWVGLGFLRKGDHVVSRAFIEDKSPGTDPHVAQNPTPIADVASSLVFADSSRTKRHVTSKLDFHGDATDGYVDVVTSDLLLHDSPDSTGFEPSVELHGSRRDFKKFLLMGYGSQGCGFLRLDPSSIPLRSPAPKFSHSFSVDIGIDPLTSRSGRGIQESLSPLGIAVGETKRSGFGHGSARDTAGFHFSFEPGYSDTDALCDVHDSGVSTKVSLDRIVDVSRADAGRGRHVYNLQTGRHWYYANGIVSHNCIFCSEATELAVQDWETLGGRIRASAGPYDQLIGDCNPTSPHHWLKKRCEQNQTKMYESKHWENPRYYDPIAKQWTEEGKRYVQGRLQLLTGARRKRFLLGIWAAAEGLVYDFDTIHRLPASWVSPRNWPRVWSIDWGERSPTVLQCWAIDKTDLAMHHYREVFKTHLRADVLGKWAKKWLESGEEPSPVSVVCDHDPDKKKAFEDATGLSLRMADKADRDRGIQAMQSRFDHGPGLRPRIYFRDDAIDHEPDRLLLDEGRPCSTVGELAAYTWDPKFLNDTPIEDNDHGCDAGRYACMEVDSTMERDGEESVFSYDRGRRGKR